MDTFTTQGTLHADGTTLHLEEKVDLPPGRVTVTVKVTPPVQSGQTMAETLNRIHREQQARGQKPMTEEQMAKESLSYTSDP